MSILVQWNQISNEKWLQTGTNTNLNLKLRMVKIILFFPQKEHFEVQGLLLRDLLRITWYQDLAGQNQLARNCLYSVMEEKQDLMPLHHKIFRTKIIKCNFKSLILSLTATSLLLRKLSVKLWFAFHENPNYPQWDPLEKLQKNCCQNHGNKKKRLMSHLTRASPKKQSFCLPYLLECHGLTHLPSETRSLRPKQEIESSPEQTWIKYFNKSASLLSTSGSQCDHVSISLCI